MKSKIYIFLFIFQFFSNAFAESLQIQAKNITLDKMSDNDIIALLLKYPVLIERPILISDTDAVVGRPPENLKIML